MSDDYESDAVSDEDWDDPKVDSPTVACPECGCEVYEDADVCPRCGCFVEIPRESALTAMPSWIAILGILGVLATILALSGLL